MKKQIVFGTVENQEDDFLRYSRRLSVEERLRYMQLLRKRAYGKKYEEYLHTVKTNEKRKITLFPQKEGESLTDFYSRLNKFKPDGHF